MNRIVLLLRFSLPTFFVGIVFTVFFGKKHPSHPCFGVMRCLFWGMTHRIAYYFCSVLRELKISKYIFYGSASYAVVISFVFFAFVISWLVALPYVPSIIFIITSNSTASFITSIFSCFFNACWKVLVIYTISSIAVHILTAPFSSSFCFWFSLSTGISKNTETSSLRSLDK